MNPGLDEFLIPKNTDEFDTVSFGLHRIDGFHYQRGFIVFDKVGICFAHNFILYFQLAGKDLRYLTWH